MKILILLVSILLGSCLYATDDTSSTAEEYSDYDDRPAQSDSESISSYTEEEQPPARLEDTEPSYPENYDEGNENYGRAEDDYETQPTPPAYEAETEASFEEREPYEEDSYSQDY